MTSIATQVKLILPEMGYFTLILKTAKLYNYVLYVHVNSTQLFCYVNQQLHHKFKAETTDICMHQCISRNQPEYIRNNESRILIDDN